MQSSKEYYIKVINNLSDKGAEGIIFGCTEIRMLVSQEDVKGINLYDITDLHFQLAAKICTGDILLD